MRKPPACVSIVIFALGAPALAAPLKPQGPAEAIVIADRGPPGGVIGLYEMTVVAAAKVHHAVLVSSTADPKAPGTLTFALSHPAAVAFKNKYGAAPQDYLKGRHIVVNGAVRTVTIDDDVAGKRRSDVTHEVWIYELAQIVSVG